MNALDEYLSEVSWAETQLLEGLSALSAHFDFISPTDSHNYFDVNKNLEHCLTENELEEQLRLLTPLMGVDAQPLSVNYSEISQCLQALKPGFVQVNIAEKQRYLIVLEADAKKMRLLTPKLEEELISSPALAEILRMPLEASCSKVIKRTISEAGIAKNRKAVVSKHLLRQQLSNKSISGFWSLRPSEDSSLIALVKYSGLLKTIFGLSFFYGLYYWLWLMSWAIIGLAALNGQIDRGWIGAWLICLLSMIPLRMAFSWSAGRLSIGLGAILKRRLLIGAMQLELDATKNQGAGQMLGRVMESAEFEGLALSGGILAMVAVLEVIMAAGVMAFGASASLLLPMLLISLAFIAFCFLQKYKQMKVWTEKRISLTNDLVENMVGHRTRLAQQPPSQWHDKEDDSLNAYMDSSKKMDRATLWLESTPRAWLVLGLLGISSSFIFYHPSVLKLAIALGAVLLCYRAMVSLAQGLNDIGKAFIAWEKIAPMLIKDKSESDSDRAAVLSNNLLYSARSNEQINLITAKGLRYAYQGREREVIQDCTFAFTSKHRVLLEGGSGSGKSTLAALLSGLRMPTSGLLLLQGLDMPTIGVKNWRKRITMAPQFHENHIFMGPFAFNLLMGRNWPPTYQDMQEAIAICDALGLNDLIQRMPAGIMQLVGDTGWQLSHGEKSRVYIARALLQSTQLLILDESFAALDAENATKTLRCVFDKANALIVIAHP